MRPYQELGIGDRGRPQVRARCHEEAPHDRRRGRRDGHTGEHTPHPGRVQRPQKGRRMGREESPGPGVRNGTEWQDRLDDIPR